MPYLKQPSQKLNADYSGVDVDSGIGDACGDSVGIGVGVLPSRGTSLYGTISGPCWDDLEGRSLESGVSVHRRTIVPTAAAMPPTFAQNSVFPPIVLFSV